MRKISSNALAWIAIGISLAAILASMLMTVIR